MSEALYNKYRPQIFEDVVGQEHIERTLKNAIASDKISHAYLFSGPRGTGKTTTARLLAKALLCDKGPTPEPDGTCEDCDLIAKGEHSDVYELDAASRTGVENVREEIIGKVNYAPTRGRYKIYIIDEVHMLSTAAFNALLKTLEEPPSHVVFVLCTTDPQKVPETILSRCQRFDFRRIATEELVSRLGAICEMEKVPFDGGALELIAHRAQGGMRDALTSLEQMIAFGNGELTMDVAERMLGSVDSSELSEIVSAIGKRDAGACFKWTAEYMETGADLVQFSTDLTNHMRNMYVLSLSNDSAALELSEPQRRELEAELQWFGPDRIARMLGVLGNLLGELKTSTNQRLSFEVALTRLIRPDSDLTIEALSERVETLEKMLAGQTLSAVQAVQMAQTSPAAQTMPTTKAAPAAHSAQMQDGYKPAAQDSASEQNFQAIEQASPVSTGSTDSPSGSVSAASFEQAAEQMPAQGFAGGAGVGGAQADSTGAGGASRDIARIWKSAMAFMKNKPGVYSTLFMEVKVFDDGDKLTISFSPKSNIVFKAANKPEAKKVLEEAFAAAGAPGLQYELVQGRGFADGGTASNEEADNIADIVNMAFGAGAVIEEID